jgi:hypothetical protein
MMRIIIVFCLLLTGVLSGLACRAQHKKDTVYLTKDSLVGVWQRDTKPVGNGLRQNFRFYPDGTFALNFSNGEEDLRVIYALKGRYRLFRDELYLTIVYRTVVEGGHIELSGSSEDFNNFWISGGVVKDIREPDIKELPNPLYISLKESGHIDFGNEDYYKIGEADMQSLEPGPPDSTALPALSYDSVETLATSIRQKVSKMDNDSAAWRIVQDTRKNFRGDPTEVRKYYKGVMLCKMVTLSSGRSLPVVTEYYFKGGIPIFVREVERVPRSGHTHENTYYFQGPHLLKVVFDNRSVEKRLFPRMEGFIQRELRLMQ